MKTSIGTRFGRLTIIALGNRANRYVDTVRCDCGAVKTVNRADMQSGGTTSCGCARRENAAKMGAASRTHGLSRHPLYNVYHTMIQRCTDPSAPAYPYYGARGIKVCDRWLESFKNFLDDMGDRPVGLELDRIDPDRGYTPSNTRWVSHVQNLQNRRSQPRCRVRSVEWLGCEWTIGELARAVGISYSTLYNRMYKRGMTIDEALKP